MGFFVIKHIQCPTFGFSYMFKEDLFSEEKSRKSLMKNLMSLWSKKFANFVTNWISWFFFFWQLLDEIIDFLNDHLTKFSISFARSFDNIHSLFNNSLLRIVITFEHLTKFAGFFPNWLSKFSIFSTANCQNSWFFLWLMDELILQNFANKY